MDTALVALLFVVGGIFFLAILFIPSMIAFNRKHQYKWPIFVVNLFFGWTFIGWVLALVWAVMPKGKLS